MKKRVVILSFLLLVLSLSISLAQQRVLYQKRATELIQPPVSPKPEYVPGEVLAKFKIQGSKLKLKPEKQFQGVSLDKVEVALDDLKTTTPELQSLVDSLKANKIEKIEKVFKGAAPPKEKGEIDFSRTFKLFFDKNVPVDQLIPQLSQNSLIEYAEPNYIFHTQIIPNDPYYLDSYPNNTINRDPKWNPPYDYQWNLKKIKMEPAWEISKGSSDISVAVIDSGVDYTHSEFGDCADGEDEEFCQPLKYDGQPLENHVNLIFVPSGFNGDTAKFEQEVQRAWQVFKDYTPLDPSIEKLNVFYVKKEASPNSYCYLGCAGIDRLLCCDTAIAKGLSSNCWNGPRQTIVIHNDPAYGGAGYRSEDVATATIHELAPEVVIHELGHSLFNLGDEYTGQSSSVADNSPNCDYSGCSKWSDLIGYQGVNCYSPSCANGNYYTSETTIMRFLGVPFEEVNERIACCEYKRETGFYPSSLCNEFLTLGRGLENYCRQEIWLGMMFVPNPYEYTFFKINNNWALKGVSQLNPGRYPLEQVTGEEGGGEIGVSVYNTDSTVKNLQFSNQVFIEYPGETDLGGYQEVERKTLTVIMDQTKTPLEKILINGQQVATRDQLSLMIATEVAGEDECLIIKGHDFINNDDDPIDDFGHGTHVAGIITSSTNNAKGIAGIQWQGKILAIKVLDEYGMGPIDIIAQGIRSAVENGAKIINMSFGNNVPFYPIPETLNDALNFAQNQGVVLVVAAGNNNDDVSLGYWPANHPAVIAVAATDYQDQKASFSNYGSKISLSAPGVGILSLRATGTDIYCDPFDPEECNFHIIGNDYYWASGTSMAAPHVVGLAALVLAKNKNLTSNQVTNILINGVDDLGLPSFDIDYGYGRINAANSLTNMDTSSPPFARISYPFYSMLIGSKFKITGSASADNFSNYTIDYADSPFSSNWSNQGIALENNGNRPISDNLLANANLSHLTTGDYYLRLKTNSVSGKSASMIVPIRIDRAIRENFPIQFGSNIYDQKPVIADINGDKKKEIIFEKKQTTELMAVEPDGTSLNGWPKPLDYHEDWAYSPTVTDIDPSYPGLEVIIHVPVSPDNVQILAFHADGTPVPGWTKSDWQSRPPLYLTYETLSSEKLNDNYFLAYGEDSLSLNEGPTLHLLDKMANNLPGWPVTLYEQGWSTWMDYPLLVSDINRDGNPEVVVIWPSFKISIFSVQGKLIKEIRLPKDDYFEEFVTAIALGDLDGDEFKEIIATVIKVPELRQKKIYVWDHQGNIKSDKWPYVVDIGSAILGDGLLTLGDFNNDNKPEILTGIAPRDSLGQYYLLDKNANLLPGFPAPGYNSSMFGVNVKLQNGNQIFAHGSWRTKSLYLKKYRSLQGSLVMSSGYPKVFDSRANAQVYPGSSSIIDLDGDNQLELVIPVFFGYPGSLGNDSYLYVFNLDYSAKSSDWPQYFHDERHTGAYSWSLFGDLNGDGQVNVADIKILLLRYGTNDQQADLNFDGFVNVIDFGKILRLIGS